MNETELRELYRQYLDTAVKVENSRKPGEGLFGIGKKPSDDPCHMQFYADMERWLTAFAETEPESGAVCRILEHIYTVPKQYEQVNSAYWMLIAVQTWTLPLISVLTASDAAGLSAGYETLYPKRMRLPLQKKVAAALKKAAGT